ncbi:hypothetical protein [Streptomyces sp. NBC_00286]|uniref:hypothetical protein n=1 Tax=Streptomyces sp. NBC_00286 TaxID=2975701 RepID=UPI002E2C542C|nr:hypothetical protein [Streptomyces sp. NBC_00286]
MNAPATAGMLHALPIEHRDRLMRYASSQGRTNLALPACSRALRRGMGHPAL